MELQVAILAAGLGTRLGRPFPKPLTRLRGGESIMGRQLRSLRHVFGAKVDVTVVVGFKLDLVVEAIPDVRFVYNELFDQTNTCKSLLKALRLSRSGGVLWTNGDVVFDHQILSHVEGHLQQDRSFVCVNTASVAEEEVKYTVDDRGDIAELSKQVVNGMGEAVGINYVSSEDKDALCKRLDECDARDYFERGIEFAIERDGQRWGAVDISRFGCVEVDVEADLDSANNVPDGREE